MLWERQASQQKRGNVMGDMYHQGSRHLQDQFDSRRIADRLAEPEWKQMEEFRDALPALRNVDTPYTSSES
jgi:hypothetical protein